MRLVGFSQIANAAPSKSAQFLFVDKNCRNSGMIGWNNVFEHVVMVKSSFLQFQRRAGEF